MKTEFQRNVIAKIKKLREEKGINQAEMAIRLGISPGQMGNIESYKFAHKYTLKQLSLVCNMLDCSLPFLLCNQDDPNYNDFIDALIKYQEM